jgi:VWFA-related protein
MNPGRSRLTVLVCLTTTAVVLAGGPAVLQDQQRPVFRGGTNFVLVDVYPRRDGRVVEDLQQSDFQVFEDGRPQTVEQFELVRTTPVIVDADRRDPNTKQTSDAAAADPRNHVVIVYLDLFHTSISASREARGPTIEFLSRLMGAGDVFGVMTPEIPFRDVVFARRFETLEAELQKYWTWGEADRLGIIPRTSAERAIANNCASASDPTLADTLILLHREDLMMSSLETLMTSLRNLKDGRKNLLLLSEGWVLNGYRDDLLARAKADLPNVGAGRGGRLGVEVGPSGMQQQDRSFCSGTIIRLANIDFERRFRDLLSAARQANVSFYPIDLGGLKVDLSAADATRTQAAGLARQVAATRRREVLQTLAENTDGVAVVQTNDLMGGIRRMTDSLSAYYLLGYYSTNSTFDGRFRRIEVKVNRPRVDVSARNGYLSPNADDVRRAASPSAAPAVGVNVTDALAQLTRIRREAVLLTYAVRSLSGLDVVAEFAAAEATSARWASGAQLEAVATDADGVSSTAAGQIQPGSSSGRIRLPLPPASKGRWQIRLRVTAGSASLEERVEVPADDHRLLGGPVMFRGGPSARTPVRPTADSEFRRNERAIVETAFANADAAHTAVVLDRSGKPLPVAGAVTESLRSDDGATTWVVSITAAAFAPGDYVAQLTAGDGAGREERLVAFRVSR